ncbi:MAG TPA: hypothetical protein VGH42_09045 [Verrucomicrobiae bacterium]
MSLWGYLWIFNPDPASGEPSMHWRHISLGHDINLAASNSEGGESLYFFNGPMPNGTTMLGPTDTVTGGWDRGYGIYFLSIYDAASKWTWWTLIISLWYPIIIFGILPAIFAVKKMRNRKSASTKKPTVEK